MPESGNALICNGVVREIKSAVYSVETPGNGEKADASEAASVYTIYLSPTAGLVDVDGMLIADDAVKITRQTTFRSRRFCGCPATESPMGRST